MPDAGLGDGDIIIDATQSKYQHVLTGRYHLGHHGHDAGKDQKFGKAYWHCSSNDKFIYYKRDMIDQDADHFVIGSKLGGDAYNAIIEGDVCDAAAHDTQPYGVRAYHNMEDTDLTAHAEFYKHDPNIRIMISPTPEKMAHGEHPLMLAPHDCDVDGRPHADGMKHGDYKGCPATAKAQLESYDANHPHGIHVKSKYRNIRGGYVELPPAKNCCGRPVYFNEANKVYCIYDGDAGQFVICDKDHCDEEYRFFEESEETKAKLPTSCKWTEGTTLEAILPRSMLDKPDDPKIKVFQDAEFPPNDKSLGDWRKHHPTPPWKDGVEWVRACKLQPAGEPPKLYNKIEPNDVMQGALGDCWLLSAIAGVAEFPTYLADTFFVEKNVNVEGKYNVQIYDTKKEGWVVVEIDDMIPCRPRQWYDNIHTPLFSQPHNNEIYVLLLEKAYAKYGGSFMSLEGGFPSNAWVNMTGCEMQEFWKNENGKWLKKVMNTKFRKSYPKNFIDLYTDRRPDFDMSADAYWDYLVKCDANHDLMGCSIRGNPKNGPEYKRTDGLVEDHAYSLICTAQPAFKKPINGQTHAKILKVRNPWGACIEWKGPFATNDTKNWNLCVNGGADLRSMEHDGIFWIDYQSFKTIFTDAYVSPFNMAEGKQKPVKGGH